MYNDNNNNTNNSFLIISIRIIKIISITQSQDTIYMNNVEMIMYLSITVTKRFEMEHMSAIFALRLIGPLTSWQVHRNLKNARDWCIRFWSIVVEFETPKVYF